MKKILTLIGIISLTGIYNAQEIGKVGVKTDTPTETFDIKGTARIRELPLVGSDNSIYEGEDNKTHSFDATRTLVADANGVIGYMNGIQDPFGIPEYDRVAKCIEGMFPKKNHIVNEKSVISIGNLEVRFNTPGLFADGPLAYIQTRVISGSDTASFWRIDNVKDKKRFWYIDNQFRDAIKFNYDQEAEYVGTIVLHKSKQMYRYTAAGWKQTAFSTSGFCHILEKVADWSKDSNF